MSQPLTERQQKQLEYLRKKEPYEELGSPNVFWASCKDCGEGKEFFSCEGCRCFILNHAGHATWIDSGGKVNPLTYKGKGT